MQLTPPMAVIKDGFAETDGYAVVYTADPETQEFTGAHYLWLSAGFGLPTNCYLDAPSGTGTVVRKDNAWVPIEDYRGRSAYIKETREPVTITGLGALDDQLTFDVPGPYDSWNNGWVFDASLAQQDLDAIVRERLDSAFNQVRLIQADIFTGDKTEADLEVWTQYIKELRSATVTEKGFNLPKEPA